MTAEVSEVLALPDKPTWLEARRQGLGSSDAPAILAVSPWKSPLGVYAEKLQIVEASAEETEAMSWGNLLEPVVATRYIEVTGRELRDPGRFTIRRSLAKPFMLATLDREILGDERGPGLLEIKTTGYFDKEQWEDGPPLLFNVQVQHQLAVTGYPWASLAVLVAGQHLKWVDVDRNDRFISLLIEREEEFWDRLLRHDPPSPDASEATKEILAKLYPAQVPETIVPLSGEFFHWDQQRVQGKQDEKAAKERITEAENMLKAAIGEAEAGMLPDGTLITWKLVKKSGYEVKPHQYRELRRKEK